MRNTRKGKHRCLRHATVLRQIASLGERWLIRHLWDQGPRQLVCLHPWRALQSDVLCTLENLLVFLESAIVQFCHAILFLVLFLQLADGTHHRVSEDSPTTNVSRSLAVQAARNRHCLSALPLSLLGVEIADAARMTAVCDDVDARLRWNVVGDEV